MAAVFPRCVSGHIEPYISADGIYYPCCWIGNLPTCDMLRAYLGERLWSQLDIRHNDLETILGSEALLKLQKSWKNGDFKPCAFICAQPLERDDSGERDVHMRASLSDGTFIID